MAVESGWVGSSAKEQTGESWMSDAREALHLPSSGWMSEMVGLSKGYVVTEDTANINIYIAMGEPTEVGNYFFENRSNIYSSGPTRAALVTGTFPLGSTLTIINKGYIRGAGGDGASYSVSGGIGGDAIIISKGATEVILDNTEGYIYSGGGGGGYANYSGGSGGAGMVAGSGSYAGGGWGLDGGLTEGGGGAKIGKNGVGIGGGGAGANGGPGGSGLYGGIAGHAVREATLSGGGFTSIGDGLLAPRLYGRIQLN